MQHLHHLVIALVDSCSQFIRANIVRVGLCACLSVSLTVCFCALAVPQLQLAFEFVSTAFETATV